MYEVNKVLMNRIHSIGGKVKIIPVSILTEVQRVWEKSLEQMEDTDLYQTMLKDYFDFSLSTEIKSLVLIALPSPPCYVELECDLGILEADIPPIYIHRDQQLDGIKNIVSEIFEPYHLHSWPVVLPKKITASICGFGKYGRNNILYIKELGSCHRLTVFGSDLIPRDEVVPVKQLRMERCSKCTLCSKRCPAGAITVNRDIIDYDKCMTFYNERDNELPQWLLSNWHNSLIGCTKCQELCPENQGLWKPTKVGHLSNKEIDQIMNKESFEALDELLQKKLTELNLNRYYDVLPRNIKLLLFAKGMRQGL